MTSETSKRRSRLFSLLLAQEYQRRLWKPHYLTFLQAQRNTRNPWCPYGMVVKALEAR